MKNTILTLLLFCSLISFSQKADTSVINYNGNHFYHITSVNNSRILVFLHGGVRSSEFNDPSKINDLDFLMEGNKTFTVSALNNGFDLLIPITNDSLNWLTNHQYCFKIITD